MRIARSLITLLSIFITNPVMADSLRTDATWLSQQLNTENLVIIDVRPKEDYDLEHIPGAVNFPEALTYRNKDEGGTIAEPDVIQSLIRELGIDTHHQVVIYDDGKLFKSSRVFWTLEVYGFKQVKVLDGGMVAWKKLNLPLTDEIRKRPASQYVATVNHQRIASKFSTQLASINPKQTVIDARSPKAYRGETSTAKRFGHIPTAINIAVHQQFENHDDANFLLTVDKLSELYSGVPKDEKVVLYCEIGTVSSTNYLVLRELGYDVANYDASWREWGNDLTLPIEK